MNFLKKKFQLKDNIHVFNLNDETTSKVADFYSTNPFPNYKVDDDKFSITKKGDKNILANQFKSFAGYNKKILEVGCGTGQLSIYFSTGNNNLIVSLDATFASIKIASEFANKNNINNIKFINADIFDDVLQDDFFDFIWCNGVLHHTKDPYLAFQTILKSLNKNGYILVGLYNKIGRFRTFFRRFLYKIFGEKLIKFIDPTLRKLKVSDKEKKAWILDQYVHPVEYSHTLDEVINWFNKNNVEFISSIPSCDFLLNEYENIFDKQSKGSYFTRLAKQFGMLFNNLGSDGGLFVVIGKKNEHV